VLEYLSGQTLRQRLQTVGRLGWSEEVEITRRIAGALERAHSMMPPIVHRDLKPENVMLLEDGTVKVMDFGIAKVLDSVGRTMTLSIGTLEYMSPEQIDARAVDARSDLYSVGLLLYEMLVGRPPFRSESQRELLNQQCTAPPPAFPEEARRGLPRGLEQLTLWLLQKAPESRPASARDLVAALGPFAAGISAAEPTAAPARLAPRAPFRVPLPLAVLIIATLSAMAGAAAFLLRTIL
jgi:eukaryotic-like serine/threonine-protein kinase